MREPGILIVEDENIVALDMRMRLESMGYSVADVVDTGALAAERALALAPALVLMDIKLKGGQDGVDAARAIRESADIPVIFVTAFTDERTLERVKLASPYGYVVKPFHERELHIAIELALYKHRYELSMRRAKEVAEESNRLKGEFLANMSHELKTPLNSVIGFTQLALDLAADGEQRDFLAMAMGSAKSLLTLIESILDFARMDAGKLEAAPSLFSLDEVLGECADALAVGAFPKGLEAGLAKEPGLRDSLIGDSMLLRRVLFNLVDNAVKFTEAGRVTIAVRAAPSDREGSCSLRFSISDTGIGMAPEKLAAIFERFIQLDPSTTRRAGGTGLGLAIAKKAVELMGGSISVESAPGRGTRFDVELPFAAGEGAGPATPAKPLDGRAVAILGFEEETARDASLAALELGARPLVVRDLSEPPPDSVILADERAVSRSPEEFARRRRDLVVATRYGSSARSILESEGSWAFTPLPVRARKLAESVGSLSRLGAAAGTGAGRGERGARGPAAAGLAGEQSPRGGKARKPAPLDEAQRICEELAAGLEAAAESGDFVRAERTAMEAKLGFQAQRSEEGERLAFSAVLLARKADGPGLRRIAGACREASMRRSDATASAGRGGGGGQ